MANDKKQSLIKLPAETRKLLEDNKPNLIEGQKALAVLKELGVDTTELENKLSWGIKATETLLKQF